MGKCCNVMRKYILIFIIGLLCTSYSNKKQSEECDVIAFYKATEVPYGIKALNGYDELIEIKTLLIPDKEINAGKYKVSISKVDDNLYQVIGTKLYVETSLCLELAIYDDAILKVIDYHGYKLGTITFID